MNYLSFAFWFNSRPEPIAGTDMKILLGIITILLIIGIASGSGMLRKFRVSKKKASQIASFAFINAFIGLSLAFVNYQIIPYFRVRFVLLIWLIIGIIWAWKIFIPKRKTLANLISTKEQEIKKYLPH